MTNIDKYLEILGLDKSFEKLTKAEQERALTVAWRKFSRKWHPDINKNPNAEKMFKLGNEANEKLKECIKSGSFESYNEEKEENTNYYTNNDSYSSSYSNGYNNNYWEKFAENYDDSGIIFKKAAASVAIILIALFLILRTENNIAYADNQAEAEYSEIKEEYPNENSTEMGMANSDITKYDENEIAQNYTKNIEKDVNAYWNPSEAYENTEAKVSFLVAKDGSLMDKYIKTGSGNDAFDDDVLATIDKMAPFKPLPEEYKDDVMRIELVFYHE